MTIKFDFGHGIEKWGIRIYQIVTGVTSDVDVPSTHLVLTVNIFQVLNTIFKNVFKICSNDYNIAICF